MRRLRPTQFATLQIVLRRSHATLVVLPCSLFAMRSDAMHILIFVPRSNLDNNLGQRAPTRARQP